ncbi:MAG: aminotransferase class IV family protein [Phycisphaerae bacterium]|nr:aminotransferase class IV family protein [Phycisphaerae bacterium]
MAKVFLNDRLVKAAEAAIAYNDSGFLYGMGLFETMRSRGGKVFGLGDHLQRLFASAEALSINHAWDRAYITEAVTALLEANGLSDARLRLTLTNGPPRAENETHPTLLITATDFAPYPAEYYDSGVRVVLTEARQNPTDPLSGHKSTCYASRLLVLSAAHRKLAAEALWFTMDNRLAEGCMSNVFLVKNGAIVTPDLSAGILPGIARKTVCELAAAAGIALEEKDLTIHDLLGADEVFVTNVVMLTLPVVAVEAHTVGSGKPGPVTKRLLSLFNEYIATH